MDSVPGSRAMRLGLALSHMLLRPAAEELALPRPEVMRLLGYKEGRTQVQPSHLALVEEGMTMARAAAGPAAALAYCAVRIDGQRVSTPLPGLAWESRSLARLLDGATGISLVAATLGPGIEALTERLFAQEAYALATVVDAAGSVLVQGLAQHLQAYLGGSTGFTPLYGPGYGDWSIADQGPLLAAAGGRQIGLVSTETYYLQPQKSLVGLIGWLPPKGERRLLVPGCTRCTMPDCSYRVRPGQAWTDGEPAT